MSPNGWVQFSVTKVGAMYRIIAQDEKQIVHSYFSDPERIKDDLENEIEGLRPINE